MNASFLMVSEKEVITILRHRGYSKENAHNLMQEIKEEWFNMGWIKIIEI